MTGVSVGAVANDNSTGLNAWNITDQSTISGSTPIYSMPINQPASVSLAKTNGWRIVLIDRLANSFYSTAGDQYILYANSGIRYGLTWGVDVNNNLWLNPLGGSTYTVASDAFDYHTNMMCYDPVLNKVSVYFDGVCIVDNYAGQSVAGSALQFGSASTAGTASVNYNLVELDVVGATDPVVLQNPASTTNAVGQKVTFTANFTPFVDAYQWLSNGVIIAGATTNSYTTPLIDLTYNGAQYVCQALSSFGNVDTVPAILTVTTDTNLPTMTHVVASPLGDRIMITYSDDVLAATATNIANYAWVNAGVTNLSAQMLSPYTVELRCVPFVRGSNYTVRVSNVRNASNVSMTPNSPVGVFFPFLNSFASYNAGNASNAPSGPPDPMSVAGDNWSLELEIDPNDSTNAVVNDLGLGTNAWNITDGSTVSGHYGVYTLLATNAVEDEARQYGWVFTVYGRLTQSYGASFSMSAIYYDYAMNRYAMEYNLDANNNLVVGFDVVGNYTVTSDGSGMNYHLHQLVYDPASQTSSYYVDGNLVVYQIPESTVSSSVAKVIFGAISSAGEGSMNYNLVDVSAVVNPFVNAAQSGSNFQIAYRGILEATTQLGSGAVWTPVATNLTSGTNVYSVPTSSYQQQYFRCINLP
jgi:hypothetical protein